MLFDRNDERTNERVLYKTKPNMILGCKKAIFAVVLLIIVFIVSPKVIQFIGEMQVYLISHIQLPLTRYTAIAFFVVILAIILYIIWQLIGWYSLEYTLTDTRVIIKSGVLSTKKNYMPYSTIQDINTSQSILARLFNVGTVSAFSAYDNNQINLENISDPSKVEDIIFNNMMGYRNFQEPPRQYINRGSNRRPFIENNNHDDFIDRNDYYDEYEPITPITRERNQFPRREYEYYPEEFVEEKSYPSYEYEPYEGDFEYNMNRAIDNSRHQGQNRFEDESYYAEDRIDYSSANDDYYQNNDSQNYYNEVKDYAQQNEADEVDEIENTSETVIRRHFDKFKK
ncbi:PH domain-containing protein [Methanobrevibacter sp.]|uniref:PH domain-containing protein n=1 Tax=Methanobrevibacter sp. TaxID=66852 RepID=UPI00388F9298